MADNRWCISYGGWGRWASRDMDLPICDLLLREADSPLLYFVAVAEPVGVGVWVLVGVGVMVGVGVLVARGVNWTVTLMITSESVGVAVGVPAVPSGVPVASVVGSPVPGVPGVGVRYGGSVRNSISESRL